MRLYHFTANRFLPAIRAEGLTRGFLPLSITPPRVRPGYPWLTTNPDWGQEWAEGTGVLPYRRNEVRLSIDIPEARRRDVIHWLIEGPMLSPAYQDLSAFGDPQNWRLWHGVIPPEWIAAVEFNPAYVRRESA